MDALDAARAELAAERAANPPGEEPDIALSPDYADEFAENDDPE